MSCLFQSKDTLDKLPCAVMCIPLKDELAAERRQAVSALQYPQGRSDAPLCRRWFQIIRCIPKQGSSLNMCCPCTAATQLSGHHGVCPLYLCLLFVTYRGSLLLAPDALSLSAYIEAVESGDVLDGTPVYEEGIGSLSPIYNFVMMVDMEMMLSQPETYVRLIPNFFFRQSNFFRHFMLAVQFTCTEGVVYPNIVLLYKG